MREVIKEYALDEGKRILIMDRGLIFQSDGLMHMLSTSVLNGGIRSGLKYAFNYDEKDPETGISSMVEDTYEEHLSNLAVRYFDLDADEVTGLSTSAQMKNHAIEHRCYISKAGLPVNVWAISTGGVDKNGARSGDPTYWMEEGGRYYPYENNDDAWNPSGTINTILYIDANLTDSALLKALVSSTEAKTAAVMDLGYKSLYSEHMATGSGTDGTVIISNPDSQLLLTTASTDCKLGEMIGQVVYNSVKRAINKQMGFE